MAKIIFVTGGVVSGLGKGITAASLGRLLKARGLKVVAQKLDPYINIDPGTMSPLQHGEVYVTEDGAETDLDLGHYERFIDEDLTRYSNLTTGKVYWSVLQKERKGEYLGKTVQVIPHITNEIKEFIYSALRHSDPDVLICEIGGTVGDIESQPFLEAARQIGIEQGRNNVLYIHVTLVPYLECSKEHKSKPTQHSVKELQGLGITPDIVVLRCGKPLEKDLFDKIALFCNIDRDCVIENRTMDASDAASYVQNLAGDEANIIFGAMYDDSVPDTAKITVIATGLDDATAREASVSDKRKAIEETKKNSFANAGYNMPRFSLPKANLNPTPAPTVSSPNVVKKDIQIPDFLQRRS